MDHDEIKYWFDKAFEHLHSGNFSKAAECFQSFIAICPDPYPRNRAQQYLKWHCYPLESMVKKLETATCPLAFSELLKDDAVAFNIDLTNAEHVRSLQKELGKTATVRKLGPDLWIHESNWENAIRNTLQDYLLPATISDVASKILRTFCFEQDQPSDEMVDLLRECLDKRPKILILKDDCIFSSANLKDFGASIFQTASSKLTPVELSQVVAATQWSESVKSYLHVTALNRCLRAYVPDDIVEIADGWWGIPGLIDLVNASVNILFEADQKILTTQQILCRYLFGDQETRIRLTNEFIQKQHAKLALNRALIGLGQDKWARKSDVDQAIEQAVSILSKSRSPKTLRALITEVGVAVEFENILTQQLANDPHTNDPHIFRVAPDLWFHRNAVPCIIEQAYEVLKGSPGLSTNQLLESIWVEMGHYQWESSFTNRFESTLSSDDRFMSLATGNVWIVIPEGNRGNNLAYRVLFQEHRLLTRQEIIQLAKNIPHTGSLNFQLEADHRFVTIADGRWVLSDWLLINDWAAQYLFASPLPLLPDTIIKNVCALRQIDHTRAIFDPENDPRFVAAPFGKWRCNSPGKILTSDVLELIVQYVALAEVGLSLNDLIQGATKEFPSAYCDLEKTLHGDERLVYCDGLWYYRPKWFYEITQEDLGQVKDYIRQQGFPVIGKILAENCLRRPLYLTNLKEVLGHDPEIENLGSVGWAIRGLQPSAVGRIRLFNYPVRSKYVPSIDSTVFEETESSNTTGGLSTEKPEAPRVASIRYITITLGFEDIRDGSLVVTAMLRRLLGDSLVLPALRFIDEVGDSISCWHDSIHNLLHGFGIWLVKRNLTYGDKIRISPNEELGVFKVLPTGERNAQVHNEGLSRSKIQSLREEAQRAKKSYHDLVVDVLQYFGVPIHVDDLWAMVNYRRSARKNYLNVILSRYPYFVTDGHGNWRYDEKEYARMIRDLEAKIQRLESENSLLRSSVANLSERGSKESLLQSRIEQLESDLRKLEQSFSEAEQAKIDLQTSQQALRAETENLRAALVKATRLREIAESSAAQLSVQIEMFGQKIASLETTDLQLREENASLMKQLAEVARREAEQNGVLLQMQNSIQTTRDEAASLQSRVDELTRLLNMTKATKEEIEAQLAQATTQGQSQNQELAKLGEMLASVQREFQVSRNHEEELEGNIVAVQNALAAANEKYASAEKQDESLKQQLALAQAELRELGKRLGSISNRYETINQEFVKAMKILDSKVGRVACWWSRTTGLDLPVRSTQD